MSHRALDRQRIDKWLWHARVVRTRSAAAALAGAGHVRVNGVRIDAPSRLVRPGDVITIALDHGVRLLRVTGYAERRGSAAAARGLYEDLALQSPRAAADPLSEAQASAGDPPPVLGAADRLRRRDDLELE